MDQRVNDKHQVFMLSILNNSHPNLRDAIKYGLRRGVIRGIL